MLEQILSQVISGGLILRWRFAGRRLVHCADQHMWEEETRLDRKGNETDALKQICVDHRSSGAGMTRPS